ncbi:endonuclease domain-containing protein [Arthrobacter sp. 7Tela_A1]|uniref:endonuclease domain-containing protein n=1 Tax=Arthrobacter sp. 7Tela_A1 TaxID=3093745 RepID=UPI003BB5A121
MLQHKVPGYYGLPDCPKELTLAASLGSSLSCASAAAILGWWLLEPPVQAHVRADRSIQHPGVCLHRGRRTRGRLIAAPADIVRDAFRCLPPLQALVIAESAVARNALTLRTLQHDLEQARDWQAQGLVAGMGRPKASPLEVCARYHLLAAGLEVQEEVLVPGVGRVDFVVAGRLIVEIDGFEFHSNRTHYRQDRNRWNAATAQGYHTLRITAELVLGNPGLFVQLVRESLADTDR